MFADVIIKAIDEADIFLFMYSQRHSLITNYAKDWTIREIGYADDENKHIVFVNIDKAPLTKWFKLMFKYKQQVDAMSEEAFNQLLRDIQSWLPHQGNGVNIYKDVNNQNKILHIIFIIQNTFAISNLNNIHEACAKALKNVNILHSDVDLYVSVLEYTHEVHWMHSTPMKLEDFNWVKDDVSWGNCLGEALLTLNKFMDPKGLFDDSKYCFKKSFILLFSNGESSDDTFEAFQTLSQNRFYRLSERYAINLGENPHPELLAEFTGKKKRVFTLNDDSINAIASMIDRLLHIGLYSVSAYELDDAEDDTWSE